MPRVCIKTLMGFDPPYELVGTSYGGQLFHTEAAAANNEGWLNARGVYFYDPGTRPAVEAWERLGNDHILLIGNKATQTYTVGNRDIHELYALRLDELWALREEKLTGGFTASSGNVFRTGQYDLLNLLAASVALNAGEISEAGGDLASFGVWRTDGSFKPVTTEAEVKGSARKLFEWFRDLEACTKVHVDALVALRDASDYAGIVAYDITLGWP